MKSPAFSFYVRDWLCSKTVSKLHSQSYSKDGSNPRSRCLNAYLYLLCEAWLEDGSPGLPDNDDDLAALARVTPAEWEAIKPLVMPKFQRDTAGKLSNDRQLEEWHKQQNRKLSGSKGGSKKVANRIANRIAPLEDANEVENEQEIKSPLGDSQAVEVYDAYPRKPREKFKKPTLEEVKLTAAKIGLPDSEASHFLNFYESKGWFVGRNPMKSWSHALSNWKVNYESRKYERSNGKPATAVGEWKTADDYV